MMPSSRSKPKPGRKSTAAETTEYSFEAIGTRWKITFFEPITKRVAHRLYSKVQKRIEAFDRNYSRFRSDSLVSEMARSGGEYTLPEDAEMLFDIYRNLYEITDGLVTPLIGQVMADAGYDADYSLRPGELTAPPRWEEIIEYDFPTLRLKRPALLDLGAAGKGYLVDIVGELLEEDGVSSYLINAGGDIRYRKEAGEPLRVGLEHPKNPGTVVGIAELPAGMSLCGSGGDRRTWDRFTHIIDPRSLSSPREIAADWTVAETTLLADSLSTTLFFTSAKQLRRRYTFEYAILYADMSLRHSSGFTAEFFEE